jgi:rhodanese-related sulfurtransferase
MAVKEITPNQAQDLLTANSDAVYIDVRTPGEFPNTHPEGAVNISWLVPIPRGHDGEQRLH